MMFNWMASIFQRASVPLPSVQLAHRPLPALKPEWAMARAKGMADNLHLLNTEINAEFIVLGSGPSIKRFNEGLRTGKKLMTLCGAQSSFNGDYYFPDTTVAGWNALKDNVKSGQTILMPAMVRHPDFARELCAFSDLRFLWYLNTTAPADAMKWYHQAPPYPVSWSIDNKAIPHNTGAQSAVCAVSLALVMGAKNIYLAGIDGFADLLKQNRPLYVNEFCNAHSQNAFGNTLAGQDEHLQQRESRDAADRYLFSQIRAYCDQRGIGLYLLNEDSHLNGTLELAKASERI